MPAEELVSIDNARGPGDCKVVTTNQLLQRQLGMMAICGLLLVASLPLLPVVPPGVNWWTVLLGMMVVAGITGVAVAASANPYERVDPKRVYHGDCRHELSPA